MKALLRGLGLIAIVLAVSSSAAKGYPLCVGLCTVTCDEGDVHYYRTYDFQCCDQILYACGGNGTAVWSPQTSGCYALIC
jgi:hypothetical protein